MPRTRKVRVLRQSSEMRPGFIRFLIRRLGPPLGGTFLSGVSASGGIGGVGTYMFSSPGLISDVQFWLNQPAQNFGWFLVGEEIRDGANAIGTARRFNSRQDPDTQPQLFISYEIPEPRVVFLLGLGWGILLISRRMTIKMV